VKFCFLVSGAMFEIECAVEYKNQGADAKNRLVATSHRIYPFHISAYLNFQENIDPKDRQKITWYSVAERIAA